MRDSRRGWRGFSAVSADQAKLPNAQVIRESGPVSPPGVIGAAVVQAARRSAHLTRRRLARQLNVRVATVRSWENGTIPLFSVPYGQLQQLVRDIEPRRCPCGPRNSASYCSPPGATCC